MTSTLAKIDMTGINKQFSNMRTADYVLVSTVRSLLLVSLKKRTITPVEFHRPEYYGISWMPGGQELVLSHSHLENVRLVDVEQYATSETGTLSLGIRESHAFLSAPHQILCTWDKRVICTNTGRNAIAVYDFENPTLLQEQRLSAARWDRLSAENRCGDHLNSVYLDRDRLFVLAHGHHGGSKIGILSYPELEIIQLDKIKWGRGMHNIWCTPDKQLVACQTEDGSIIDIQDGRTLWKAGSQVLTRGLAASDDLVLVGESQFAERSHRSTTVSGIWLVERDNWKTVDYLCLGPYGAVHDIRILDVADHAHHGIPFAGLPDLLTHVPGETLRHDRLRAALLVEADSEAWSDYKRVLGVPTVITEGGRECGESNLCIITQPASKNKREWRLDFSYELRAACQSSHVSVVYYWGDGNDTNMSALLLQPNLDGASLSYWINEGDIWRKNKDLYLGNLPLCGDAKFVASETNWVLCVNDMKVCELDASPHAKMCGEYGIRFCGSRVYPRLTRSFPALDIGHNLPCSLPVFSG